MVRFPAPLNARNSSGDDIPECDPVPKFGVGALYPENHERGKILSAVADDVYITSVLNVHFLARKNSEINREY